MPLAFASWSFMQKSSRANYWRIGRQLLCHVRAHNPEQIHCARCLPEGLIALGVRIRTGVPYLCYVHGEEIATAERSRELRFLARRALKGAKKIIANSENTKRMLCGSWGLSAEKVQVLYPGVDSELFVPAPPDLAWRDRMGWSGRRVILTVGRLQKRKGHDQLIRALPQVAAAVPHVHYAIIGDGKERQALEDLAVELNVADRVQFVGEIDDADMIRAYQQCDIFALPNRQIGGDIEGFGIVLLEAQSCGKPVLAGSSGGTAETMDAPRTGCVVSCDDSPPLAAALIDLLTDLEGLRTKGQAARQWIVDRFDWKVLGKEAEKLFAAL
jgi:phosphatidylinositol alpha-1,6-mannosyltransferase